MVTKLYYALLSLAGVVVEELFFINQAVIMLAFVFFVEIIIGRFSVSAFQSKS